MQAFNSLRTARRSVDTLNVNRLARKIVLAGIPSARLDKLTLRSRCVRAPDVDLHAICKISTCPTVMNTAQMQPEARLLSF